MTPAPTSPRAIPPGTAATSVASRHSCAAASARHRRCPCRLRPGAPHVSAATLRCVLLGLPVPIVAINTIALLASSVTMQFAVNAIKRGDRRALRNWLIPTVILGIWFISGQLYEYTRLGFLPDNGIFAAVFFTLTGFHGAHVTGGILMNSLVLFRTVKGQFSAQRHLAVDAASIYWHFVDVVWIGLFTVIYIIG